MDWDNVVHDLGPRLYRFFCGTFPAQTSSDLVQETLIRLVRKVEAGQFDATRSSLKAYTYGIARFVRLEAIKSMPPTSVDDSCLDQHSSHQTSADIIVERNQEQKLLRNAIKTLPPAEQEVILLLIDKEISLPEIAVALEMPLGTIKSHIHRAKERLRQALHDSNRRPCHDGTR